jgi:hypothetical protein
MSEMPTGAPVPRDAKLVTKKRVWHLIEVVVVAVVTLVIKGAWDHRKQETQASVAASAVAAPTVSPNISPHIEFNVPAPLPPPPTPSPVSPEPGGPATRRSAKQTKRRESATEPGSKFDLRGAKIGAPTQIGDNNKMDVDEAPKPKLTSRELFRNEQLPNGFLTRFEVTIDSPYPPAGLAVLVHGHDLEDVHLGPPGTGVVFGNANPGPKNWYVSIQTPPRLLWLDVRSKEPDNDLKFDAEFLK